MQENALLIEAQPAAAHRRFPRLLVGRIIEVPGQPLNRDVDLKKPLTVEAQTPKNLSRRARLKARTVAAWPFPSRTASGHIREQHAPRIVAIMHQVYENANFNLLLLSRWRLPVLSIVGSLYSDILQVLHSHHCHFTVISIAALVNADVLQKKPMLARDNEHREHLEVYSEGHGTRVVGCSKRACLKRHPCCVACREWGLPSLT